MGTIGCLNFLVESVFLFIYFLFIFFQLCVFTFWVLGCVFRYDFLMKTMFVSPLPPVVCSRVRVLFTLVVLAYV